MATAEKTSVPSGVDVRVLSRMIEEGYGPGAWHGPDLNAALSDVSAERAFWRPAAGRHNIAEIALHHAYCARFVRSRLSGEPPEPFLVEGDDWFELPDSSTITWPEIRATVETQQEKLADVLRGIASGTTTSVLPEGERFDLVLGITCHAVYHAGQVRLIRKLAGE
jgi:hypothetical protein